jgi:hypothetical protein
MTGTMIEVMRPGFAMIATILSFIAGNQGELMSARRK